MPCPYPSASATPAGVAQPYAGSAAQPSLPPPPRGGRPDGRPMFECTNRPGRALGEPLQQLQQPGEGVGPAGAPPRRGNGSLWGDPDESIMGPPGAGSRLERSGSGAGTGQVVSCWTDLATILETRSVQSAQSSPHAGSMPDSASQAAAAAVLATGGGASRSSFESGRTAVSSGRGPSAAALFPTMPVAAYAGQGMHPGLPPGEGSSKGGKTRVVSLLAKGLKSMGQKQTWANLLPNVSTATRRAGSSREGSLRGGDRFSSRRSGGDRSWRGSLEEKSWRGMAPDRSFKGGAAYQQDPYSNDPSKHGRARPPAAPRALPKQ